jgi:hypothetical protein
MIPEIDAGDFGPLPIADNNAELQRRSIAAIHSSLPAGKFLFRDERAEDAGVDGSLELLINGRYTNLRSQVQLKSTDSSNTNNDGSISLQVRVSNLNYLLNGPSPIYVLYVIQRDELRFAWARDERRRFDETSPGWMQQETVTIRFAEHITSEKLDQIHQRIRQEALFKRKLDNILDTTSATENIVVRIDRRSLEISDPAEVMRILTESGTAIISAGYAAEVKNLVRLLELKDAQTPRILLVQAHAEYNLHRYQAALGFLAEATLSIDQLSSEDRLFLQTMRDGCEFQTGRIDMVEFSRRLEEVSHNTAGRFAVSNRLNQLRYTLLTERRPERRQALLEQLRVLVEEIQTSPQLANGFKIHAAICWNEAYGNQLFLDFMWEIGEARIQLGLGRAPNLRALLHEQLNRIAAWEKHSDTVITDAVELGSPQLVADALVVRGQIGFRSLTNQKMLSRHFELKFDVPAEAIDSPVEDARRAAELFAQSRDPEGELRAKMLIADLHDLVGNTEEAQAIAQEVLPKATAMDYAALVMRANEHLSGQSLQSRFGETMRPRSEEEKVINMAQYDDDRLRQDAAQMLGILSLPQERLPVLQREYESLRGIALEQLTWCRHIKLIQDKRHEQHTSTIFRTDPTRFCTCVLYDYVSMVGDPDWSAVIAAFKQAYCANCPSRSPFVQTDR